MYPILLIRIPYSVAPYGIENYPSSLKCDEQQRASELFAQTTVSSPVTVGNRRRLDGDLFKPLAYEETPDRAARLLNVWGRADNNFVEFQRLI